jgi:hypothetical protein
MGNLAGVAVRVITQLGDDRENMFCKFAGSHQVAQSLIQSALMAGKESDEARKHVLDAAAMESVIA